MGLPGGVWLVVAVDLVVLAAGLLVAARLVRRDGAEGGVESWYAEAASLAREVERTATEADPPADPDRVARRLLPLSGRIRRHVRTAPRGIDAAVNRELFELGVTCQRIATEHRRLDALQRGLLVEERLEALGEDAVAVAEAASGRA